MTALGNGGRSLPEEIRRQSSICSRMGSPLTALLLRRIAEDVEQGGICRTVFEPWDMDGAIPGMFGMRIAGALHHLVLSGRAPMLGECYPTVGGRFRPGDIWPRALELLASEQAFIRDFVAHPPQTNEVGRAGALLAGFLVVARNTGLPLRCLEAGASAGLLLHWDKFAYDLGGTHWGDPASPVRIANRWTNASPDLPSRVRVAERAGCDMHPIDLGDPDARLRLKSFIWGDNPDRLTRLEAAIDMAMRDPAPIEQADAADWVARQLAQPRTGMTTVFYTCFASLYFDRDTRASIRASVARAAEAATSEAPFAVLQLEGEGDCHPELRLYQWPSGRHRVLATADILGMQTHWLKAKSQGSSGPV